MPQLGQLNLLCIIPFFTVGLWEIGGAEGNMLISSLHTEQNVDPSLRGYPHLGQNFAFGGFGVTDETELL